MSSVRPLVNGVGIIASTAGGSALVQSLRHTDTVVHVARTIAITLALWTLVYWLYAPYIKQLVRYMRRDGTS